MIEVLLTWSWRCRDHNGTFTPQLPRGSRRLGVHDEMIISCMPAG
jgi:hypothetical protein